jgi:hypothetical protein
MTENGNPNRDRERARTFRLGREELVVRRWYEALSIINDAMIGIWFVIGSVLFFSPTTTRAGTWLFVIGSIQLTIRPVIRLGRLLHLRWVSPGGGELAGPSQDF